MAIGRAIVREPDVFLFDEPLSNLDAALRVSTRVEIARLHRLLGATMVYVTHDQIEAMTLADRIVVMNQGRIEQVGKPLDLYYTPANLFVAGFIGSPAMNFFPATVERVEGGEARVEGGVDRAADPAGRFAEAGRPTDHRRAAGASRALARPGAFTATGLVELVERLGEASYAHVRRADEKLMVAEIRGRETPSPGQTATFSAPAEDIHVFDDAGRRL